MKHPILRFLSVLLLASLLFAGQGVQPVYAAAYVVNSLADTIASDSACTLREAIQEANNGADTDCPGSPSNANDTITFNLSGTITLGSTLPNIVSGQGTLTIDGSGQNITVSGNNTVRVMIVDSGADLTLRNLTIANASTPLSGGGVVNYGTLTVSSVTFSGNSAGSGGGIVNLSSGVLTISNSTFSNNSATFGGGIDNAGGTLTISNSIFSSNSAANSGGGIYNNPGSTLTVSNSTFSGNSAINRGGGIWNNGTLTVNNSTFVSNGASSPTGEGGGIWNNGTLAVNNSTFSANSASNFGGGISNSGTLTVVNSTFSANSASGSGGGIYNNLGSTLTVVNSTFSANSAAFLGGGIQNNGNLTVNNSTFSSNSAGITVGGGGINNSGSATLRNTIIANSTSGGDCVGTLSGTNNNNLIESAASACGLTNGVNGNIIGQDPNLGTLIGSPAFFPLNAGSPAIDAGDNTTCAAAPVNNQSQNGVVRPQDGDGNSTVVCDIGAYELTLQPASYVVNTLNDNIAPGDSLCTLREAILAANNDPAYNSNSGCGPASSLGDAITFSVNGTITLTTTLPNIVSGQGTLTIDGSGQNITISGGGAVRVMWVNAGADLTLRKLTIANGNAFGGDGGGVANFGTLSVDRTTFANSSAAAGGGIANFSGGTLLVSDSAFSGNSAVNGGGGIANYGGATLSVANTTFFTNTTTGASGGGGIWNNGNLTVNNSTFSGNSASTSGGGIRINGGSATLRNTIIANSASGGDCVGTLSGTNNNNLIESTGANACGLTDGANGNIIGQDPNLGALTGSPAYLPLNAGSPAINAGDNATCAATDQRGVSRPQGSRCDIGAFEMVFLYLPLVRR
jgi:CSLREA domain-containing protein